MTDETKKGILQFLEKQGVSIIGWIFAGAILYGFHTQIPTVLTRFEASQMKQVKQFTDAQERLTADMLETARIRSISLKETLQAFRQDEIEDRRLLVEVLRRSDLTSEELSEAIDATASPPSVPQNGEVP